VTEKPRSAAPAGSPQHHWDSVYTGKAVAEVSWYEAHPAKSLELIRATGVAAGDAIIDVGGGASLLAEALLAAGYCDLTVLDVSGVVLQQLRERLGAEAAAVKLLQQDVTQFEPPQRYALWHDRAVFHFLIEHEARQHYVEVVRRALLPSGQVIISGFGPEGPEKCSGLQVVRYDAAALAAQLGTAFALIDSSLSVHRTPRGVAQQFVHCRFQRQAL
jgi:ubiquinone/menaquinone biosynthesis C-methylase UbiE